MEEIVSTMLDGKVLLGALVCFVAVTLQGYTGFGGALIMFPLLSIIFEPIGGIVIASFVGIVSQLLLVVDAVKKATWRELAPLLAATITATFLGTLLLVAMEANVIRWAIGLFVIGAAALLMANIQYRGPRGPVVSLGVGAVAGGVSGAFGVPGGPIFVLYFLAAPVEPAEQRANLVLGTGAIIGMMFVGLAYSGQVDGGRAAASLAITPFALAGIAFGAFLFRTIPSVWFRQVALWLVFAAGLASIAAAA